MKKHNPKFYGVSQRCNNWLKHFKIEASGVFYNSIDKKSFKEFYNDKKEYENKIVITYAGRIIKEKGVYLLLDAFKEIEKKYKNVLLIIAGDGPILEELKQKYKDKNIIFKGKLPYEEVMTLYNSTDIFVHPSMYPEGLPTVILESGIMKCAIIATDRGGTVEVINDEKYGIIIEENQEAVKEAIVELLENPKKLKELQENIHKRVIEQFVWEITAKNVSKELER